MIGYLIERNGSSIRFDFVFRLKFQKLINGYRQFDPTRGTHYIIDVLLVDQMKTEYVKRAELMRPLGKNFTDQISIQLNASFDEHFL